jgi:hypothetical protein
MNVTIYDIGCTFTQHMYKKIKMCCFIHIRGKKYGKVKCILVQALSLCTDCTAHRGSRGFMTMALEGGERSASRPSCSLPPWERPGTHCTGGWVGPRASLDRCGKSRPTRIQSPDRPAHSQSLYQLHYPAHTLERNMTVNKLQVLTNHQQK